MTVQKKEIIFNSSWKAPRRLKILAIQFFNQSRKRSIKLGLLKKKIGISPRYSSYYIKVTAVLIIGEPFRKVCERVNIFTKISF